MLHYYLKTVDGEETYEFSEPIFQKIIENIEYDTIETDDRTLYSISEDTHYEHITMLKDDYIESIK